MTGAGNFPGQPFCFAADGRSLRPVAETSPTSCADVTKQPDLNTNSCSAHSPSVTNSSEATAQPYRRVSLAQDQSELATADSTFLRPAVQSCLKNPFRLSLPHHASGLSGRRSEAFPSDADSRALAFGRQLTAQQQRAFGITSSQNAVHQHYDRSRERATILETEDARRASDPDVATDFEQELFRWAEQEDRLAVEFSTSLRAVQARAVSNTTSLDVGTCANDDGYRADLDLPMIDRDQHRIGTRIHTQAGARNRFRAHALAVKSISCMKKANSTVRGSDTTTKVASVLSHGASGSSVASTLASPTDLESPIIKTPRFSLTTEVVPRVGSPSHERQLSITNGHQMPLSTTIAPAIVLPMESPQEAGFDTGAAQDAKTLAVLQARAHARQSTLNAPKTPYHWTESAGKAPSSSLLQPPARVGKEAKATMPPPACALPAAETQPSVSPLSFVKKAEQGHAPAVPIPIPGPTRLQSRRPNGMRLRNLPDASIWAPAEIEVNGKKLEGRDMKAVAVYDPRNDPESALNKAEEATAAKGAVESVVPDDNTSLGQALLNSGQMNPPPPTPPRGPQKRGAARVRVATLNAVALKANMMPSANAQVGTAQNAHIQSVAEEPACAGLGIGVGLGLTDSEQGCVRLRGANAPESEVSSPGEGANQKKHRSLPDKLPEKVIPRPLLENWIKVGTKPQAQPEDVAESESMQAWAMKTFQATGEGSVPGPVNAPPSAYIGIAPSPCPDFTPADNMSPTPGRTPDNGDAEVTEHRAAAEAQLTGTPTVSDIDALSVQARASPLPAAPKDASIIAKSFTATMLPDYAVSLSSASTTASGRPFYVAQALGVQQSATACPINIPRTAVLAKDRTRRHADADENDRSAQLDSVLSAFSTEQLLAHLASRRVPGDSKPSRKASYGAPGAAHGQSSPFAGDMSPRMRSPLVPQTAPANAASPNPNSGSPTPSSRCTLGTSNAPVRASKRNSVQRALVRNRQRLAGSPMLGDAVMSRTGSVSSVGSMDMVREDSISSFGSFISHNPILAAAAEVHIAALSTDRPREDPLIDLTSPNNGSNPLPAFAPLGPGAKQPPTSGLLSMLMETTTSQASTDFNPDDRVSLLTDTSSNQVPSMELPTPAAGVPLAPIGTILGTAFARAYLQTRSQTPMDFARTPLLSTGPPPHGHGTDGRNEPETSAMLMERADSVQSPMLSAA
ncbi:hypothetical protein V8E36_007346 [Tilletia maclaganii]